MTIHKVPLDLPQIKRRLQQTDLPEVDRVVGIGRGGTVPAALVAYELGRPLTILPINYRDPDNKPRYDAPRPLGEISLPSAERRILLVDDVAVSGRTLALARQLLEDRLVTTLVMKGQADIVLFPEIASCVIWPWRQEEF